MGLLCTRDTLCLLQYDIVCSPSLLFAIKSICCLSITGDTSTIISLQPALRFNGGGHINHSIFWETLSPHGGGEPEGDLLAAIVRDFGSFEKMKNDLVASSVAVQGSGWGWLGYDSVSKQLKIAACANQDPLKATTGLSISLFSNFQLYMLTVSLKNLIVF